MDELASSELASLFRATRTVVGLAVLCTSACRFDTDVVALGQSGGAGAVGLAAGGGGSTAEVSGGSAPAQSNEAGTFAVPVGAVTAHDPAPPAPPSDGDSGSGTAQAGISGSAAQAGTSGSAAQAGTSGSAPPKGAAAGSQASLPVPPCDLSGRWFSTLHYVIDTVGQQQVVHDYIYYEIIQQGDSFMVTKGLECGNDTVSPPTSTTTVDFKASWQSVASRATYTGRAGRSVVSGAGCQVDFDKWYTVRGASMPYYLDPTTTLPKVGQTATRGNPGWEDWDADGNPGITGVLSGSVAGQVFLVSRSWTSASTIVDSVSANFVMPLHWNQEANVLSYFSAPVLGSDAVRVDDDKLHFAEFTRLPSLPAAGDDLALCAELTARAATLTPLAAGN